MKSGNAKINHSFEYEHDLGEVQIYFDIDMSYQAVHDSSYGSDADGNRGMEVSWNEDLEFTIKYKDIDVTELVEKLIPDLYAAVEKECDGRMDDCAGGDEDCDDGDRKYDEWKDARAERGE